MTMNKVIVIGCPGAGKSTFARALAAATGLELHYLDMLWHKPDKTNITREEFDSALARIMSGDGWIIDGNYIRTLEMRLRECDTVFMLDLSTEICLEGARSRVGKKREDMPWVEEELDGEFRQWIEDFAADCRPRIYELLEKYRDGREIIVFHSREEAESFIERLGRK